MGKEKDKPQITTQTNAPWSEAQPYLNDVMSEAQRLYQQSLSKPPQLAPLDKNTRHALDRTASLARKPVPGLNNAFDFAATMLRNAGMTGGMKEAAGLLSGYAANNGVTDDLRRTAGYLTPFATGAMQEDPRLQKLLDRNAERAANAAATRFGGGRYGSAAIGQGVGSAVADANNATMLQSNENARTRQLQAIGMLDSLFQNAAARGLSASGALGQLYDAGVNNAMAVGAMLPALNNLRFDPASRAAGVGDYLMGRQQTKMDMKRQAPWDDLGRYNAILSGMGSLGGTQIGTAPKQGPSAAQGVLGGAVGGATIGGLLAGDNKNSSLPLWGTIGGGLLGLFA